MLKVFRKPCIFITSLGRTGTHFFGYRMSQMIDDCISVHQPDVLYPNMPSECLSKIKEFGVLRMTVGKFLPSYSLRVLNVSRQTGMVSDTKSIKYLRQIRKNTFQNLKSMAYLEANWQYRGLIDLLPLAFPNSRIVYIIRDPRFWVRSWMNVIIPYYSRRDYFSWIRNGRLTPYHFKSDPYQVKWRKMTNFEKLCWAWAKENSYALDCASKTDAVKVLRYEDLFDRKAGYETFLQMLQFVTRFPDGFTADWTFKPELLKEKVASTSGGKFPEWPEWSDEQVRQIERHCCVLMKRFNYGEEPEWQERLARLQETR